MARKIAPILIIVTILFTFSSCAATSSDIIGGDSIRYSYCVFNDEHQLASIPIISKSKIKSVKFTGAHYDNADYFSITQETFDEKERYEYKGYNIYFVILKIQALSMDKVVHSSINNIMLDVDGREITLNTPYFKVSNGIDSIAPKNYNDGTLLFGGAESNTLMTTFLPSQSRPATMGLIANKDVTLTDFGVFDYLDIEHFEVDSVESNHEQFETVLKSGSATELTYSMKYTDESSENSIIRIARYVSFTDNGERKAFIDGAGVYVYFGQPEQQALKNYIDSL